MQDELELLLLQRVFDGVQDSPIMSAHIVLS